MFSFVTFLFRLVSPSPSPSSPSLPILPHFTICEKAMFMQILTRIKFSNLLYDDVPRIFSPFFSGGDDVRVPICSFLMEGENS